MLEVAVAPRPYRRSPITMPGYRKGQKPANAGRKFPPEPLNPSEVHALINGCGRGLAGQRDRALIVVLWRSGLRIGEALALYPKDVDTRVGTIAVLHGKGDQARVVGIDPEAAAVIDRWLETRRKLGLTNRHPLFCTIAKPNPGRHMQASVWRESLKRAARRAGVEKRVHPHGFRHTHTMELVMESVPIHIVKSQLGHSSLATTERYANHLFPGQLVQAIQRRVWETPA